MKKFFLGALLLLILISGYVFREKEVVQEEFLMDTFVSISAYGANTDFLKENVEAAFREMRRITGLTERFSPESMESNVQQINQEAGKKPVKVDPLVWEMLSEAKKYQRLTNGAFEITIGPLVDLWKTAGQRQEVPTTDELKAVLMLVNSDNLILDAEKQTAFLSKADMSLDLGAVAKGYAVESAAEVLKTAGIKKAIINAGGDLKVIGKKKRFPGWQIGIQNPRDSKGVIGVLTLENEAVATSGDYQRVIKIGTNEYHHLLSTENGYPVNYNQSVTIICPHAGQADLLSTALFLLESKQALNLVDQLPDVEVVIVTAEGEILISSGLENKFHRGENYD